VSQFLPTLTGRARKEAYIQLNGLMLAAGLKPTDIVKSSKRYDADENKTIVRFKFKNVPGTAGDLLLEVPGKH
jgi:hypothetical protein